MDIELGYSMYSETEVNELIAEIFPELDPDYYPQVAYVDSVELSSDGTSDHGHRLLKGLVDLLDMDSNIIAFQSDLDKLRVRNEDRASLGFRTMTPGNSWYIRGGAADQES